MADTFNKKVIHGFTSADFATLRGLVEKVWRKASSDRYRVVESVRHHGPVPPKLAELLSLR